MTAPEIPTFADVEAAAARIKGVAVFTPLLESPTLCERARARVFLKLETMQRTGTFKFRGAYNRLSQLAPDQRKQGVVAYSSGNHAQGIALAAKLLGIPAVIVMPSDAPRVKLENTRALGAEIVTYDRARESREDIAARIATERGRVVVPSFDDPHIVAGQGTIGLEIAAQAKAMGAAIDTVLTPCSGGGLASGIALALSGASPTTRVMTVEPEDFDGARISLDAGQRMAAKGGRASIADALLSPVPGHIPFAILRAAHASGIAVSDDALLNAVAYAARELKLVVEAGGAAALAAVLSGIFDARGKTIAIVISGGNIDPELFKRCLNESRE